MMISRINIILLFTLLAFVTSCGHEQRQSSAVSAGIRQKGLDSMKKEQVKYYESGKYDSLIICSIPYLNLAVEDNDTSSILYAGLSIAQAHLFLDNNDSAKFYIDLVQDYANGIDNNPDINLLMTYYNILGIYSLKIEMDYSKSLEYFLKNYEYGKTLGDTANMIISLTNISGIHLTRNDSTGIRFAKEAYELACSPDISEYLKCHTAILMGEMLSLNGKCEKAREYLDSALEIALKNGFRNIYTMIYTTYGNLYRDSDPKKAEEAYEKALSYSSYAEPTYLMTLFYNFSELLKELGMTDKAMEMTKRGIEISGESGSIISKGELLHQLSDLYSTKGDSDSALNCYKLYASFQDSIGLIQKEQEFGKLMLDLQNAEHMNKIQAKEVEVLKANKRTMVTAFILSLIAALFALFLTIYKRQRKLYKTLVAQHQQYLQRLKKEEENNRLPKDASRILFDRLETAMKKEKLYRQKNISLEKLAELLNTNRTYLSKAVNTFAGTSFNNYINIYRINDATDMMSQPGFNIPFKQLADMLGYNSVSVFCRAFQRETGCPPGRYKKEINA